MASAVPVEPETEPTLAVDLDGAAALAFAEYYLASLRNCSQTLENGHLRLASSVRRVRGESGSLVGKEGRP